MLHGIIYNSGDFFLPKKVKKILDTDLIGTHKKHFIFRDGQLFIRLLV